MSNEEKTKSKKRSKEKNQTLTVLQLMKKKTWQKLRTIFRYCMSPQPLLLETLMSPWPVMITRKVGKWLKFSRLKQEMIAFLSMYSQQIF